MKPMQKKTKQIKVFTIYYVFRDFGKATMEWMNRLNGAFASNHDFCKV